MKTVRLFWVLLLVPLFGISQSAVTDYWNDNVKVVPSAPCLTLVGNGGATIPNVSEKWGLALFHPPYIHMNDSGYVDGIDYHFSAADFPALQMNCALIFGRPSYEGTDKNGLYYYMWRDGITMIFLARRYSDENVLFSSLYALQGQPK